VVQNCWYLQKKGIFYILRTLLSVVVRYEFVNLSWLTLIVIGLRVKIIRDRIGMTAAHVKCLKALCRLRFDWIQDPEVVLDKKLKTVGLTSEYLETDPELFEVFHKKLYLDLERKYHPLLALVTPAHFRWQLTVMWLLIKCRPTHDSTYDYVRRAILTPSLNKD